MDNWDQIGFANIRGAPVDEPATNRGTTGKKLQKSAPSQSWLDRSHKGIAVYLEEGKGDVPGMKMTSLCPKDH